MILINSIYLIIAVVTVFGLLRGLDFLNGKRFKHDVYPVIESHPIARAMYRSAWVLGVCILAAGLLGT